MHFFKKSLKFFRLYDIIFIMNQGERIAMKKKCIEKKSKIKKICDYKKCGAITCINNNKGFCDCDVCELYENILIQED